MKELRLLSCASPNKLTRALLEAGRGDGPSREARANAAVAIGIAATVATTATAGGAVAATGTATGTVAASKWLGGLGLLKLVGATVVGGAFVVGVVREPRFLASPAPATSVVGARAPAYIRSANPVPSLQTAPQVALAVIEPAAPAAAVIEPAAPAAAAWSPPRRSARPPSVAGLAASSVASHEDATLRREVERLDRARAALLERRPDGVLAELKAYDRAFPDGALGEEAELLRIEALAQMGEVDSARRHVELLLARDEQGPHGRRLRALLASLPRGAGAN
jgi:hypothetical protein